MCFEIFPPLRMWEKRCFFVVVSLTHTEEFLVEKENKLVLWTTTLLINNQILLIFGGESLEK